MTELFSEIPSDGRGGRFGLRAARERLRGRRPRGPMTLSAPETVRGGLFFQSRVEIRALAAIEHPRLVLDEGWVEGMQFNRPSRRPRARRAATDGSCSAMAL